MPRLPKLKAREPVTRMQDPREHHNDTNIPRRFAITRGGTDNESEIVPLMAAFNADEGITWQPDIMIPALRQLLNEPATGLVLLARDPVSGAAAGYGIVTFGFDIEYSGRDAVITELFVESSYRGRGVGRQLLDALLSTLRGRGINAVHLMVRPENAPARALYESLEFRVVPRQLMTKRLSPVL